VTTSTDDLTIVAGAKTDLFVDPAGNVNAFNSAKLLFENFDATTQCYKISAKVAVEVGELSSAYTSRHAW